jgi:hypothetical protein
MKISKLIVLTSLLLSSGLARAAIVSEADRALGQRLKVLKAKGLVRFGANAAPQLTQLIRDGFVTVKLKDGSGGTKELNVAEGLHIFLDALMDDAEARKKPFAILSLGADRGPHGHEESGLIRAVDLSVFGNYSMRIDQWSGIVLGLEELLTLLPASEKYNIGLPRRAYAPGEEQRNCGGRLQDGNACDRLTYAYMINDVPKDVFDSPLNYDYFLGVKYNEKWPKRTFPKTSADDLKEISTKNPFKQRILDAAKAAEDRGVTFSGWFADSLDHLHVAVDSNARARD